MFGLDQMNRKFPRKAACLFAALGGLGFVPAVFVAVWLEGVIHRLDNRFWETQIILTFIALALFVAALPFQILRAMGKALAFRFLTWLLTMASYVMFLRHAIVLPGRDLTRPIWILLSCLLLILAGGALYFDYRAEPGTAPNGGPATPVGNSRVPEGPPSVS